MNGREISSNKRAVGRLFRSVRACQAHPLYRHPDAHRDRHAARGRQLLHVHHEGALRGAKRRPVWHDSAAGGEGLEGFAAGQVWDSRNWDSWLVIVDVIIVFLFTFFFDNFF